MRTDFFQTCVVNTYPLFFFNSEISYGLNFISVLFFFLRRSGINHAITVENHRRKISVLSKIFTTSELGTEEKGANQAHFSYPARGYISRSWENCADDSLATFSF